MSEILLATTSLGLCRRLRHALVSAGHHVVTTGDGMSGLRKASRQPFHILVTDLLLPQLDGLELIRYVRQRDPTIHTIALSEDGRALTEETLSWAAHEAGADQVISKPVNHEALVAMVGRVAAERHAPFQSPVGGASQEGRSPCSEPLQSPLEDF